jgi:hypothetical protein
MQCTDDQVLHSLNVDSYLPINLFSPRGENRTVIFEALDGILTQLTRVVDSTLQVKTLLAHEDSNYIGICVMARLLFVVGEDILSAVMLAMLQRSTTNKMWYYVGPSNIIVGSVLHRHDHWM